MWDLGLSIGKGSWELSLSNVFSPGLGKQITVLNIILCRWDLLTSCLVDVPCWQVIGHEETVSSCTRGGLEWSLGRIYLWRAWLGIEMGCPWKWWDPHPWRCIRGVWTWHSGTWFSGGTQQVKLMVGLGDSDGLFQRRWFWDSTIILERRNTLQGRVASGTQHKPAAVCFRL